jgi:hypothetical protein
MVIELEEINFMFGYYYHMSTQPYMKNMPSHLYHRPVRMRTYAFPLSGFAANGALLGIFLLAATLFVSFARAQERDITAVGPNNEDVALSSYNTLHYVSVSEGSDAEGGGGRNQPWSTILHALKQVHTASASGNVAILVAEGTYDHGTIAMREYVDLFGGFDADGWHRDIDRFRTILDGQDSRRVALGANHARIDGFVITGGRAFGHGGGILCDNASPEITNNRIIANATVEPIGFRHDLIHQNGNRGGGIACLFNSVPRIANNIFADNTTEIGDGAGLALYGWVRLEGNPKAVVENNVFTGNTAGAKDFTRTRSSSGGGISCHHEASPFIRNNVIALNAVHGNSDAGGIYSEYYASPIIERNWIVGNVADDDGGGYYTMRLGQPVLSGNVIAGNWTRNGGAGGARVSKEGRATFIGNLIVRNLSGSGLASVDGRVVLQNNIIADNLGGPGFDYRQNHDYFQPSRIQGNVIVRNEKGPIRIDASAGEPPIVTGNVLDGPSSIDGNTSTGQAFAEDGRTFHITSVLADPDHCFTLLEVSASTGEARALAGRVIRLEDQWSVIRDNEDNVISVWGRLASTGDGDVEILPTYTLK